jgi:hypothetical protein
VHDRATSDALAVRCSQSDSAMSAQALRNSTHFTMHCNHARKQTGELVAMLVEEPLPSHVKPSGRLDFFLRPHPPRIQPSPAQATDLQLICTGTMRCLRRSAEHQRAANTAAKNTLTLSSETLRKLPFPAGTTKDPEQVRTTMPC